MKTTHRSLKYFWTLLLLIGALGVLFGVQSVSAYHSSYEGRQTSNRENQCFVSPGQTVVEWKSTYQARCRLSFGGICIWPIPHKHTTYKVTVNEGVPLRTRRGSVIPAIDGDEKRGWLTYDSHSWKALENDPYRKDLYTDFEPVAPNEYVVMVETRYRLFSDVDSTLGICIQQQ